jgi:hypothetical protein
MLRCPNALNLHSIDQSEQLEKGDELTSSVNVSMIWAIMRVSMATMYVSVNVNRKTTRSPMVLHTFETHQFPMVLDIIYQDSHVFWIRHNSVHELRGSAVERGCKKRGQYYRYSSLHFHHSYDFETRVSGPRPSEESLAKMMTAADHYEGTPPIFITTPPNNPALGSRNFDFKTLPAHATFATSMWIIRCSTNTVRMQ